MKTLHFTIPFLLVFILQLQSINCFGQKKTNAQLKVDSILNFLGTTNTISNKEYKQLVENAKSISIKEKYNRGLILSEQLLGRWQIDHSNYKDAFNTLYRALYINEKTDKATELNGAIYNTIATGYAQQLQMDQALYYFNKSLACYKESNKQNKIGVLYNNIASVYYYKGYFKRDFTNALNYYLRALKLNEEIKDTLEIIITLDNLGLTYSDMGNFARSKNFLYRALDLEEKIKNPNFRTLSNLARNFALSGASDSALILYNKVLTIAKENKDISLITSTYGSISDVYKDLKQFEKAYIYLNRYTESHDSLLTENNMRSVNELSASYDAEKREKQIELLNEKDKHNNIIITATAIGIILLFIFILFIFYSLKQKQKANILLEQQKKEITFQRDEIDEQKKLIEQQKDTVEEKNKEITDSIYYARRIQHALLPAENYISRHLSDYFIYYKPKDIVSGDYYWALKKNNQLLFATADCTGHGVPGAFMSMLGVSFLNEITMEKNITQPHLILNQLREDIIRSLNPEGSIEEAKDGMDIVLCSYNFDNLKLTYASANNSFYVVRESGNSGVKLIELKSDKMPVGKYNDDSKPFSLKEFDLQKNDIVYTFTDGFADQFGGPLGKKFKYKQFQELVLSIAHLPMHEQKKVLDSTITAWMDGYTQIDDILVIGIKV